MIKMEHQHEGACKDRPPALRNVSLEGGGFDLKRSAPQTERSLRSAPQTQCSFPFVDVVAELLCSGNTVRFSAPGSSMHPTIRNNEVIGVEPVEPSQVKRGDIILYRNGRGVIAHRVVRIANERLLDPPPLSIEHSALSFNHSSLDLQFSIFGACAPYDSSVNPQSSVCSSPSTGPPSSMLDPQSSILGSEPSALSFEQSSLNLQSSILNPQSSALSTVFILRGDASYSCDEPVDPLKILGKVVSVERNGRTINLNDKRTKIINTVGIYAYRLKRAIRSRIAALEDRPLRALRSAKLKDRFA